MNVQMRDVMAQDEGVHMLGRDDVHEGTGRQRLERTDAFGFVGPKIREARDVSLGFDQKPTEIEAICALRDEGVSDEDQIVFVDGPTRNIDGTRVAIAHETAHRILDDEDIRPWI